MDVTEAEHALTNVLTGFSTTQNYVQTLAQNMEVQATMIYTYILYVYIWLVVWNIWIILSIQLGIL